MTGSLIAENAESATRANKFVSYLRKVSEKPDFSCVEFLIGIREFIPLNKEGKLQVKNRTF